MLCELCYDDNDNNDDYFATTRLVVEISVAEMSSMSSGYLSPSSRRSMFLCHPCVERVGAAGQILSRWKGKLDLNAPASSHSSSPSFRDVNNVAIQVGDAILGTKYQMLTNPRPVPKANSPPILKSSASVDSGITFDSDSNGEFFEAEDVSRPSTAFASAEEDNDVGSFVSAHSSFPTRNSSPPTAPSPGIRSTVSLHQVQFSGFPTDNNNNPVVVGVPSAFVSSATSSSSISGGLTPTVGTCQAGPFSSASSSYTQVDVSPSFSTSAASFAGYPASIQSSPRFPSSASLPSRTPPPPPYLPGRRFGVSHSESGSLSPPYHPMMVPPPPTSSSSSREFLTLSPSVSPSIAAILAAAAAGNSAYNGDAFSMPPPPPTLPARQSLKSDSRTSLFSLKECQMARDAVVPPEKRFQLQPLSTSFVGQMNVNSGSVNNIPRPRPIQKSVVDLDPALENSEDQHPEYADATTSPLMPSSLLLLRPSSLSASRRGCGFCLSNGERQRECMSHRLKNPDTLIVECPQLRKFVCPLCQATGDFAHTQGYCPLNDGDVPTVKHLKKKRSSAGRLAGGKNVQSSAGHGPHSLSVAGASIGGVVDPCIIAIGPQGGKKG